MTSEQALNWAKTAAVTGGLLLGGYSTFVKGEPGAELAYKALAKNFNELRTEFEKQRAYNEGFIAGFSRKPPRELPTNAAPAVCKKTAPRMLTPLSPQPVSHAPVKRKTNTNVQQQQVELPAPMPPLLQQLKTQDG